MHRHVEWFCSQSTATFRSPSCMVISWSYASQDFSLLWTRRSLVSFCCSNIFVLCIFLSFTSFCYSHLYSFFLKDTISFHSHLTTRLSPQLSVWSSDVSQSEYLVSLSYPMEIFSTNIFGLFVQIPLKNFTIQNSNLHLKRPCIFDGISATNSLNGIF